MPFKKNKSFERFLKKIIHRKGKILTFLYPGLRYAHKKNIFCLQKKFGKCLFANKDRFANEKKKTKF